MSTHAADDWLTLEVLYFSAGLRSLVVSDDQRRNSAARPAELPDLERIGLDNDLELKPGDRVVDFARFDVQSTDAKNRSIFWLGIYGHAVDTVGDRGNFLGLGIWFGADRILRHQIVLESLAGTLDDLSGRLLDELQRRSVDLVGTLQKFRHQLNQTGCMARKSSEYGLASVDAAAVSRAYVRVPNEDSALIQVAGAMSMLVLPGGSAQPKPPSRILYLLGPELPKVPRRSWALYPDLAQLTGRYSTTDSLLESVLNSHLELREEIDRLREANGGLTASLDEERRKATTQKGALNEYQGKIEHLEADLDETKDRLATSERELRQERERTERTSAWHSIEQNTREPIGQSVAQGRGSAQKPASAKAQSHPTGDLSWEISQFRKTQDKYFSESSQYLRQMFDRLSDIPGAVNLTKSLVMVATITIACCFVLLCYLTYANLVQSSLPKAVEPRSGQNVPAGAWSPGATLSAPTREKPTADDDD